MQSISPSAFPSSNGSRATLIRMRSPRSRRGATASGLPNVRPPSTIDAAAPDWPIEHADAVLSINMVHISPWASALGLLDGAARVLPTGGPLILYGPWLKDDIPTAPSNLAFDRDLKSRESRVGPAPGRGFRRGRGGAGA